MRREFRKPLINFVSKKLLKFRQGFSKIDEIAEGTKFQEIIGESDIKNLVPKNEAKKVILCSGQVYFDLIQERSDRKLKDVHIIRLE